MYTSVSQNIYIRDNVNFFSSFFFQMFCLCILALVFEMSNLYNLQYCFNYISEMHCCTMPIRWYQYESWIKYAMILNIVFVEAKRFCKNEIEYLENGWKSMSLFERFLTDQIWSTNFFFFGLNYEILRHHTLSKWLTSS